MCEDSKVTRRRAGAGVMSLRQEAEDTNPTRRHVGMKLLILILYLLTFWTRDSLLQGVDPKKRNHSVSDQLKTLIPFRIRLKTHFRKATRIHDGERIPDRIGDFKQCIVWILWDLEPLELLHPIRSLRISRHENQPNCKAKNEEMAGSASYRATLFSITLVHRPNGFLSFLSRLFPILLAQHKE